MGLEPQRPFSDPYLMGSSKQVQAQSRVTLNALRYCLERSVSKSLDGNASGSNAQRALDSIPQELSVMYLEEIGKDVKTLLEKDNEFKEIENEFPFTKKHIMDRRGV
eukprot:TRINITY_DN8009_c0_g1_i1.p1 TRINITY_DN8009_c0_g1~~TRINITY_DN8009_c0_g1_i1.p1  ORF type:complete len:121 (-),score=31.93 TRINITY_DN8009_c0_g1_i1:35-355(-)